MKILIALLINLTVFAGIAFGDLNNPAVSPIFRILPDQPLMDQSAYDFQGYRPECRLRSGQRCCSHIIHGILMHPS